MPPPPAFWASSTLTPSAPLHGAFAERLSQTVSSLRLSTRGVNKSALEKQALSSAWLLECLHQGFCCLPSAAVALPRSTASHSSNRLNSVPYGYDVVTRVLEAAISLGWVGVTPGFDGGDQGQGQVTRVQAQGDLLIHFHKLGVQWQDLPAPPPEDLIVIAMGKKGKDRRLVVRTEDARVPAMQENLDRINKYLLTQCIHLNCADSLLLDPTDGVVSQGSVKQTPGRYNSKDRPRALSYQAVTMRRIFAHGSLSKGGRFYGGSRPSSPASWQSRRLQRSTCFPMAPTLICCSSRMGSHLHKLRKRQVLSSCNSGCVSSGPLPHRRRHRSRQGAGGHASSVEVLHDQGALPILEPSPRHARSFGDDLALGQHMATATEGRRAGGVDHIVPTLIYLTPQPTGCTRLEGSLPRPAFRGLQMPNAMRASDPKPADSCSDRHQAHGTMGAIRRA